MVQVACTDAGRTRALAACLAARLRPGDLILLSGDLGAGKTTFTQGMAAALGVGEVVTSPTFTLVNIHPTEAGFDLVHVDVYRLERLSEVEDLALPELLDDGAVVVVEWGERAAAALPAERLEITLEEAGDGAGETATDGAGEAAGNGSSPRLVRLAPVGGDWAERLEGLGRLEDLGGLEDPGWA